MRSGPHGASGADRLGAAERRRLLVEWNATQADYPAERCIHELFAEQVARTPEATALVWQDRTLTYRELDVAANRLAHQLRAQGTGPETIVGLCLDRSLDMIVGVLGVLKAGGAYLPLDPDYPPERLAFMLRDAAAPLIVTHAAAAARCPGHHGATIDLDRDSAEIAAQPHHAPASGARPGNLAYVIYTSGSTGVPKGVMITHQNVCNKVVAQGKAWSFGPQTVCALVSSLAFDPSVEQIFVPLTTGGAIAVLPELHKSDLGQWLAFLARHRVTYLNCVPSLMTAVVAQAEAGRLPDLALDCIALGGDVFPAALYARIQAAFPGVQVLNLYGPTEVTVNAAGFRVPERLPSGAVPIGHVLANYRAYVLDERLEPVPVGATGELFIAGDGLARGYLARSAQTATQFIADPHGAAGQRMYRTGDLARWSPGGTLDFLGRRDHQVKIRGFRIELGEVEAALLSHPGIAEAAVVAREDDTGARRLVAYVVGAAGEAGGLRTLLRRRLPEHMIPAEVTALAQLPLTANGKVDRAALADLSADSTPGGRRPRNPTEALLARAWEDVLGIDDVGIDDDFFELGGDSIQSLLVVARMAQAGLKLTVRQIFDHPTIGALAGFAAGEANMAAEQGLVAGEVALTPIQHWFFADPPPNPDHFNQSVLLSSPGRLVEDRVRRALERLARHHDAFRLRFRPGPAGGWSQSYAGRAEWPLETFDLAGVSPDALEDHANRIQAGLRLDEGPLARAALFDLGAGRGQRLLLVIHHLVVDGVSWRILREDLETLLAGGNLRRKTSSVGHWSERLSHWSRSAAAQEDLPYWRAQVGGRQAALPQDHPGGRNAIAQERTVLVTLNQAQSAALLQQVPKACRARINDVLLTAVAQAFGPWIEPEPLLVNLEGHGREELFGDIDLSRTVGWFTSMFPVLLDTAAVGDPRIAVKRTAARLAAVPRRGISYGALRHLSGEALAASPAQVCFNYLGQFRDGEALRVSPEPAGRLYAPEGERRHLIDINGAVTDGCLQVVWTFSAEVFQPATIQILADRFGDFLGRLIQRCQGREAGVAPAHPAMGEDVARAVDRLLRTSGRSS